ncbi:MAG: PTS sugar transporter subunit IIA [Phycisphaerales bacterium]
MKIREIVVEEAIITELSSSERAQVVPEMIDALVEAGAVDPSNRDTFIKAVLDREKKASTGFGHGVAVPHVKHDSIDQIRVTVGLSRKGVDFSALDRKPVYSIFMLLSPADRPEDHLDAMQQIVKYLGEPIFRSFLRQASSVEDVLTLLAEADDKQFVH